jgi:hypothetical protein
MWIGARTASSLSVMGELTAPSELLGALDDALRVPTPKTGLYL